MTNYELYRLSGARHPTGDAVRTLALILATVLAGLFVTAIVPDRVWDELSVPATYQPQEWHGNVAASGPNG